MCDRSRSVSAKCVGSGRFRVAAGDSAESVRRDCRRRRRLFLFQLKAKPMQPSELYGYLTVHCDDLLVAEAGHDALRDAINAAVVVTEIHDRVTTTTLLAAVTTEEGEQLFAVLDGAAAGSHYAKAVVSALSGPGFDFADPRAIGFIEQLRPQLGDALADKVQAISIQRNAVLPEPATSEQIETALRWQDNSQRYAAARSRASEVVEAGGTWDDITAAFLAEV